MTILNEERWSLGRVARELGIDPASAWRWSVTGCRGVVLETIVVGARRFSSREAVERFVEATTRAANERIGLETDEPESRREAAERADRELSAAGF